MAEMVRSGSTLGGLGCPTRAHVLRAAGTGLREAAIHKTSRADRQELMNQVLLRTYRSELIEIRPAIVGVLDSSPGKMRIPGGDLRPLHREGPAQALRHRRTNCRVLAVAAQRKQDLPAGNN